MIRIFKIDANLKKKHSKFDAVLMSGAKKKVRSEASRQKNKI